MQHTATHCKTLQQKLQHITDIARQRRVQSQSVCSTLQHTAAHCSTLQQKLQHITDIARQRRVPKSRAYAAHCNTLQHNATTAATHH